MPRDLSLGSESSPREEIFLLLHPPFTEHVFSALSPLAGATSFSLGRGRVAVRFPPT